MSSKTKWVIAWLPVFNYAAAKEVLIIEEGESCCKVAFGCTAEVVQVRDLYDTREEAEAKIEQLKRAQQYMD